MQGILVILELTLFAQVLSRHIERSKDGNLINAINGLFFFHFGLSCAKFLALSL